MKEAPTASHGADRRASTPRLWGRGASAHCSPSTRCRHIPRNMHPVVSHPGHAAEPPSSSDHPSSTHVHGARSLNDTADPAPRDTHTSKLTWCRRTATEPPVIRRCERTTPSTTVHGSAAGGLTPPQL
ncbi:hypothetical protein NDU88_000064 [Pleurodeles waltl]|uniref:Uncharacterized protein n=1 Tax=Pleurodeles waltl TaxID=8319 RepID=A0AAV7USZ6_PLEWA|nr:hypothetical protein NDU88_000064 [Pleurodeles waltl]